jgi:hypothetical protein
MTPNKLILSIEDNEEVKTAIAKLAPGDTVTIEVTAKMDEATAEQAVFSVKSADIIEEEAPEAEIATGEDSEAMAAEGPSMAEVFGSDDKA